MDDRTRRAIDARADSIAAAAGKLVAASAVAGVESEQMFAILVRNALDDYEQGRRIAIADIAAGPSCSGLCRFTDARGAWIDPDCPLHGDESSHSTGER